MTCRTVCLHSQLGSEPFSDSSATQRSLWSLTVKTKKLLLGLTIVTRHYQREAQAVGSIWCCGRNTGLYRIDNRDIRRAQSVARVQGLPHSLHNTSSFVVCNVAFFSLQRQPAHLRTPSFKSVQTDNTLPHTFFFSSICLTFPVLPGDLPLGVILLFSHSRLLTCSHAQSTFSPRYRQL